jgi:hypothetical protein
MRFQFGIGFAGGVGDGAHWFHRLKRVARRAAAVRRVDSRFRLTPGRRGPGRVHLCRRFFHYHEAALLQARHEVNGRDFRHVAVGLLRAVIIRYSSLSLCNGIEAGNALSWGRSILGGSHDGGFDVQKRFGSSEAVRFRCGRRIGGRIGSSYAGARERLVGSWLGLAGWCLCRRAVSRCRGASIPACAVPLPVRCALSLDSCTLHSLGCFRAGSLGILSGVTVASNKQAREPIAFSALPILTHIGKPTWPAGLRPLAFLMPRAPKKPGQMPSTTPSMQRGGASGPNSPRHYRQKTHTIVGCRV